MPLKKKRGTKKSTLKNFLHAQIPYAIGAGIMAIMLSFAFVFGSASTDFMQANLFDGELFAQGTLGDGAVCNSPSDCTSLNCIPDMFGNGTSYCGPIGCTATGCEGGDGSGGGSANCNYNGICDGAESEAVCPADCTAGNGNTSGNTSNESSTCNYNGICEASNGETEATCSGDCYSGSTTGGGTGTTCTPGANQCQSGLSCISGYCAYDSGTTSCDWDGACESGEDSSCGDCGTCNYNGTCDSGEYDSSCSDCSYQGGTACDYDGICEASNGETYALCSSDCTSDGGSVGNTTACNNNGTCDAGESSGSCPADCWDTNGGTMTFPGTIYYNGQYVDPSTKVPRSCLSPNAWMKEGLTAAGERGFHCMPNYTQQSYDVPVACTTGTLYGTSSSDFSSDTCSTTGAAVPTGTTSSTKDNGESCSYAADCASSFCDFGTCAVNPLGTNASEANNINYTWDPPSGFTYDALKVGQSDHWKQELYQSIPSTSLNGITDKLTVSLKENGANVTWCTLGTTTGSNDLITYPVVSLTGNYDPNKSRGGAYSIMYVNCTPTAANVGAHTLTLSASSQYRTTTPTIISTINVTVTNADGTTPTTPTTPTTTTTPTTITTTETCGNNYCNASTGETLATCPADCQDGPTTETCGNNYCNASTGETVATCPADCNAGITTPEAPKQCKVGEKCPQYSWCNQGSQCSYPDGQITCTKWDQACPSDTKYCSKDDTNCIEPGATGSIDGWCSNSMECFVDGQKFCQRWSNNPGTPASCPAGSKLCPPGDTNCVEPGEYGSLNAWCKDAQQCYKKDGTGIFCAAWDHGTSAAAFMQPSCPADTGFCRPDDEFCLEVGETGPSNAWCGGAAKQCYTETGQLTCVASDGECSAGSSVCRAGDTFCVEPGTYSPIPSANTQYSYWCGGSFSLHCYDKADGRLFCGEVAASSTGAVSPGAWDTSYCPSGTSRCRNSDSFCLDTIGATGPSGSWCAVGQTEWNDDNTVTCVAWDHDDGSVVVDDEKKPTVDPVEETCIQVTTEAYDPATKICKTYASPCNVPAAWSELKSNQFCRNGVLEELDDEKSDTDLKEILVGRMKKIMKGLDNISSKVDRVPDHVQGVTQLKDLLAKAILDLKQIGTNIKGGNNLSDMKEKVEYFRTVRMDELMAKVESLKGNVEFVELERRIKSEIFSYEEELLNLRNKSSNYAEELKAYITKMKDLLKSAKNLKGQALTQMVEALKRERKRINQLAKEYYEGRSDTFVENTLKKLSNSLDRVLEVIAASGRTDTQVTALYNKFKDALERAEDAYAEGLESSTKLVKEAIAIQQRLADELEDDRLTRVDNDDDIRTIFEDRIDPELLKTIMKEIIGDQLALVVDTSMQELISRAAAAQKENILELKQSINNLQLVVEEQRKKIVELKSQILSRVEETKAQLAVVNLPPAVETNVEEAMNSAALVNWCGNKGAAVESEVDAVTLALEDGDMDEEAAENLAVTMAAHMQENNEECYRVGASPFRDTPMHEWYFASASYNQENGFIKGDAGKGTYRPADEANLAETIVMATRVFNLEVGKETTVSGDKPPGTVPEWTAPYVNIAKEKGYTFKQPLSDSITREEAARVFHTMGEEYFAKNGTAGSVDQFKDSSLITGEYKSHVGALAETGIIKGRPDGSFDPNGPLLRSEFGIINQRTVENVVAPE